MRLRLLSLANAVAAGAGMAACLYAMGAAVWVIAHRWAYPYELEWSEGIMAQMVQRVMWGQPVYHAPSVDWMPLGYTPLYYFASAALALVRGLELPTLRLVSIAGTCLTVLALVSIVTRITGHWRSALAGAGMLAAAFAPSGFWFDTARVDSLMVGLSCAGAAILYRAESSRRWALGAFVLVLAFWCKQPALFFVAACGVLALRRGRRAAAAYGTVAGLGILLPLALLHVDTDGWSTFCLFTLVSTSVRPENARLFFLDDLLLTWWPLLALGSGWIFLSGEDRWYTGALLAAGLTAAFGARLRPGGYDNVLLPLQVSLATLGVCGAFAWASRLRTQGAPVWVLVATQVVWTTYSPAAQVPSERDAAFWEAFLSRIAAVPGEVLIPTTAFIQRGAGKASHATWLPAMELQEAANPQGRAFKRALRERLASGHVGAVVLTEEGGAFGMDPVLEGWSKVDLRLPDRGGAGYPVTGWRIRPRWLLVPPCAPASAIDCRQEAHPPD